MVYLLVKKRLKATTGYTRNTVKLRSDPLMILIVNYTGIYSW